MTETIKYLLDERRIPTYWYNLVADLPVPPPPVLHPGTLKPVGPDDLASLFPMALILQEVTGAREVEIPRRVRDIYRQWRPSPLFRARRLERALDTPARIYYKYEGISPVGSHKPNTAVPQAFYNKEAGTKRITTETGAGQWGSALAFAGGLFDIEVQVFMVRVSYQQKPYRRALMETYGASCIPSPSAETQSGRAILAQRPDHPGSLGIAISEAVEVAASQEDTKYALGSVLNHVLLHQTVIGQEAMAQMEMAEDSPDVLVGCTGGGSNFAGLVFPFLGAQLRGGKKYRMVAVEPAACPSLTRGKYAYDFGDTGHLTPLAKMHTLGSTFIPPASTPEACATMEWRRWFPTSKNWASSRRWPTTRRPASRPESPSPVPRASSQRLRPTTRSRGPSTRLCAVSARASRAPSSSTCADMATSTCRPTPTTSRARWWTSRTTRTTWPSPWPGSPRWPDGRRRA